MEGSATSNSKSVGWTRKGLTIIQISGPLNCALFWRKYKVDLWFNNMIMPRQKKKKHLLITDFDQRRSLQKKNSTQSSLVHRTSTIYKFQILIIYVFFKHSLTFLRNNGLGILFITRVCRFQKHSKSISEQLRYQ